MKKRLLLFCTIFALLATLPSIAQQVNGLQGIYPNPVKDIANIVYNSDIDKEVVLEVYDLAGRQLYSEVVLTEQGKNEYNIEVMEWGSGVYFVRMDDGNELATKRMIVD